MYSQTHIPNQKPNEHVIMFLRQHWIVVLKIVVLSLAMAFMPIALYLVLMNLTTYFIDMSESMNAVLMLAASAYYLFVLIFTFSQFVDYYLDVWIVSNERVVNIEQRGLFTRVVSEKDLGMMQDVTSEVHGILATILNYGDVFIQTAAEKERFVFKNVPYADEVARRISNLATEYRKLNKNADL